jgi:hypothetical protein
MLSAVSPADERKMDQESLVKVDALLHPSPLRGVCGSSKLEKQTVVTILDTDSIYTVQNG